MIYNEYRVKFYVDLKRKNSPILQFIEQLPQKHQAKILKYIDFLRKHEGVLDEPYAKHIKGKIRELRVDFGRNRYRIFYFVFIQKTIVMLHGFLKRTTQTPPSEIRIAEERHQNVINHQSFYV
ncbi:MAG: type II toxin-antitoxin system RelE/ParE family toxin [Patescibacteria group bacterium]